MTLTIDQQTVRITCDRAELLVAVIAAAALLGCTPPEVVVVQSGDGWVARRVV